MAECGDVLIVGGGVIGLTTAYYLAEAGARVLVVDQGNFGQEASWAGAGILPPSNPGTARTPFDRLRALSSTLFPSLSAGLRERTGIDNGYLRCGGLEFADVHDLAAEHEWRGEGVHFEVLDAIGVRRLEPNVATPTGTVYHLPELAQLRNPRHLKALLAACRALGVRLRAGCLVHGFERLGARVTGAQTLFGTLSADRVLLTAGAWSDALLGPLGWRPGIRPVRGQIALLRCETPLFRRVLMCGSRYVVPRTDGRVLVGSTEEEAGFDKRTTAQAIHDLLGLACALVPELAGVPLERCWAGLRPGSPDGLPYLGRVPDWDNVYVAAGHFRAGIQLSPGTGLVMKQLLLGEKASLPVEAFGLERGSAHTG
jgi:glycine oxidase